MGPLNWAIVGLFILLILGLSFFIGRAQKNQDDYYLGGRKVPSWLVGTSLMSNQVSAISLIGAPAFIALKPGGGLIWLQYEMAIPLAMMVIISLLVPVYWKTGGVTIYEYLERRFGAPTRSALSLIFLISRSMGAGVILLATSYVAALCMKLPLAPTILLIGLVSLLYTTLGGIKADILTDIIQLVILWTGSLVCLAVLAGLMGGVPEFTPAALPRLRIYDFASTGLGDGNTFAFWPMMFGGFFLYVSYYGCDQSQAQRLLATRDSGRAKKALVINGVLRFPLVITYCAVGVLMIPFLERFTGFADKLKDMPPDYLMPMFFITYIPDGVLGLIIAGILAASMSSLDSTINSLSAATWEDFLGKLRPSLLRAPDRLKVRYSRLITVAWGALSTAFALRIAGGSETVIELVNKIGSAFYGPIAGVFALGILSGRPGQKSALAGLAAGFTANVVLWMFFQDSVSWMWWNLSGFAVTVGAGYLISLAAVDGPDNQGGETRAYREPAPVRYIAVLAVWFLAIILFCAFLQWRLLGR